MAYLISFELADPEDSYNNLHKNINKLTTYWIKPLPTVYLVKTNYSLEELYARLMKKLTDKDRLFIIEVDKWPAAYINQNVASELHRFFDK